MAVKDPAALLDPNGGPAKQARRDAVGAEIPVTVHASRTNQGMGKTLPSVHEETKTVIVLQQGAVVRLTASLTTGETVVLTNRMTGADVLCRVGNIKSQAGIQHYVDLEFIQRAPGFWGDAVAASGAPAISQAPPAAVAPTASISPAAPVVPASAPPAAPIAVAAPPQPPAKVVPLPSPTPSRSPVRAAPPSPSPAVDLPPAASAEELQTAPLAEPVAASWMAPKSSPVAPVHSAMDRSNFGSISASGGSNTSSGSPKTLLAAAAAVLLVLGGAAGWFYSQHSGAANSHTQQQGASAPAPQALPDAAVPSAPIAPVPAAPVAAVAIAAPQPTPQTDIIIESRPGVDPPVARVQPQPQPPPAAVTRASLNRRSIPVEPLKVNAPKAKVAAARLDAPAMVGNLNDAGLTNALLASAPAAPAPPPAVTRVVIGGQLQPPQVLSSRPPTYPVAAKAARIQGVVALDALVDETGKVVETTVVSGPAPLAAAAQESVRGWKYKPAQLNGKPIPVHTKVSVNFSLQ